MEQNPVVKRLYVGGLGHTISEAELQERFGKFGNVTDTEIVTRKDEQGKPTKTFAYINITISEKELKKCISVLNKTKWKGGTLQIELAKESFLHRLARERQETSIKKEKSCGNGMTNVLQSMKKSGVVNFHVKAVPGTGVPDHKNWVVGKFGRVLPILHLKGQQKNKIIKYDPSKYCHNLKKLDQELFETVPISQLTWHLETSDDSISKKRQGQCPITKQPPKKKMKIQDNDHFNKTELNSHSQFSSTANKPLIELVQNCTPNTEQQRKVHSVAQKRKSGLMSCRNGNRLYESDTDSEEEIRAIIAKEREVQKVNSNLEPEDDNIEVVGDDFELKYATHWSLQKAHDAKNVHKAHNGELGPTESESDYDSAGTDEIIAKMPHKKREKNETLKESKTVRVAKDSRPESGILTHAITSGSSNSNGLTLDKLKGGKREVSRKTSYSKAVPAQSNSEDDGSSDSYLDTSESGDEDYETMMQSCYRLDLTLKDLERLASENMETSDEESESNRSDTRYKTNEFTVCNTSNSPDMPTVNPAPQNSICPEEIVSAILEGESSDEENPKQGNLSVKVQPFRGMGSLSVNEMTKELVKEKLDTCDIADNQGSFDTVDLGKLKRGSNSQCAGSASNNLNCKSFSLTSLNTDTYEGNYMVNPGKHSNYSACDTEKNTMESRDGSAVSETKLSNNLKPLLKRSKMVVSAKRSEVAQNKNLRDGSSKSKEAFLDSAIATSKSDQKEKHMQDNEKRLAALHERQRERELQKKLIQRALTNLESQSTQKQKHIVFDLDGESEDEVHESIEEGSSKKLLGKGLAINTSGKLFESSEDESDTTDDEDDRFKIKPQFEGKTGEKLMHLQSRFGTDERFRMDARFLESDSEEDESKKLEMDEEEELASEKKKNLEILKNLLHINVELPKPSKQTTNAKKFKDINALRYDPTRQDHAVFERKPENTEKGSRAKKKKKREEGQKLPEVSKETFYNVAVDLKAVLGSTKHDEKPEMMPWDKHNIEQATPAHTETLKLNTGSNKQEEIGGFTFSFFGAEEERSPKKEEPYVIETIKSSRVAWQEDPRFQDSSSEEEDEPEVVEREDIKEMSPVLPRSSVRFFFFTQDDHRLKEGPKLFCKSSDLDEDRDNWESRRQILLEDCRKKHKDARRKVKAKQ